MNKLKIGYEYLFYFIYNHFTRLDKRSKYPSPIRVGTRSHASIEFLIGMFTGSIFFYLVNTSEIKIIFYLFVGAIVFSSGFNIWFFIIGGKQYKYIAKFSLWPHEKQKKWNNIMRVIIFLVITNFLISFYLLSQGHPQ